MALVHPPSHQPMIQVLEMVNTQNQISKSVGHPHVSVRNSPRPIFWPFALGGATSSGQSPTNILNRGL